MIDWQHIAVLAIYQAVVGTFLSIFWRRSGNLGVSATTHAVIDSLRNAAGSAP